MGSSDLSTISIRRPLLFALGIVILAMITGSDRTKATTSKSPLAVHTASVVGGSARAGNQFVVGIELESGGDEVGIGFTLNFDPTKLSISNISSPGVNPDVSNGPGIPSTGASLAVNANQAASGRIAIVSSSGSFYTPSPPNRLFVLFRFTVAANAPVGPTQITFGDNPVPRSCSGFLGNLIALTWVDGAINIEPPTQTAYEGDVAPRLTGDETILAPDVTQLRRFAAGLDTIATTGEFQRADMAPRATLGDGVINSSDVVQARRYATALDPLTIGGGPTGPPAATSPLFSEPSYGPDAQRKKP